METEENQENTDPRWLRRWLEYDTPQIRTITAIATALLFFMINYWIFAMSPSDFPVNKIIEIKKGQTAQEVAGDFYQKSIIKTPILFRVVLKLLSPKSFIVAGDYRFNSRQNVFEIAYKLHRGDFGVKPLRLTIPEGVNNKEIAKMFLGKLPNFNERRFLEQAQDLEGYLFPDTYVFNIGATEREVIEKMTENFDDKTAEIKAETKKAGKSFEDILIMASIIEEEANTPESRRLVSGILWNRIEREMRLQVDATFYYTLGKFSLDLTKTDLASDSPYNTYRNKGLPPTPISNPGLDSLKAALNPTRSSYLYYLNDKNGDMHYAKTFEGHKENRINYLDN